MNYIYVFSSGHYNSQAKNPLWTLTTYIIVSGILASLWAT